MKKWEENEDNYLHLVVNVSFLSGFLQIVYHVDLILGLSRRKLLGE